MEKKAGITRRDFFNALVTRTVEEVKEGYKEGLAAQEAKKKNNGPRQ